MKPEHAWAKAIEIAGNKTEMAKIVGRTRTAVSVKVRPPPEWVLDIERATGISRHQLRPDIFGPEPKLLDALK